MKNLTLKTGESVLPRRPGHGTVGRATWVRANHFPVTIPDTNIYQYDVKLVPEVKNRRKLKRMFEILENHAEFAPYASHTATDYGKIIVSTKPLNPTTGGGVENRHADKVTVKVAYTDSDESQKPTSDPPPKEYSFIIERVAEIHSADFTRYVNGDFPDYNPAAAIQALNIILAKYPAHKTDSMVSVGRNKFFVLNDDRNLVFDLGGCLEARKGFYSSIRPSVHRVLCNLNVCTTAFYA